MRTILFGVENRIIRFRFSSALKINREKKIAHKFTFEFFDGKFFLPHSNDRISIFAEHQQN